MLDHKFSKNSQISACVDDNRKKKHYCMINLLAHSFLSIEKVYQDVVIQILFPQ